MQKLLGVDQPDWAQIIDSMVTTNGSVVSRSEFIQPKVEGEIAVILAKPLRGPSVTRDDVLASVGGVAGALEVIDSRIRDWRINLVDTVADIASTGRSIVSSQVVPITDFDPRLIGMAIWQNDSLKATAAGAAALGDPLEAVAWLANTLYDFDEVLESGHFVMTGSLHAAFDINSGDEIVARFDRLGEVRLGVR
jgi:2-keto-4-pentenoate hydratase